MSIFKTYYALTKPGIIYGNAINTSAGFFLASAKHVEWLTLPAVLVGSSLVIASGCVLNNYIDRDIDNHMPRTKKRALVRGDVSGRSALIFGAILGAAGFTELSIFTNWLTVGVGLLGYFFYVVMYSLWWKRRSSFGTIVGSVSGAVPPVAGYVAVTNHLDAAAVLLFAILVLWQMPHFYAIAMYRRDEYAAAKVPVLSVTRGMARTRRSILVYIACFTVACAMLTVLGYTGYIYLGVMLLVGLAWLGKGMCIWRLSNQAWGRKMFLFSLTVTLATALLLSIGARLP